MAHILDINNIDIEIILYDGTPDPRNPFNRLTPGERRRKAHNQYVINCWLQRRLNKM